MNSIFPEDLATYSRSKSSLVLSNSSPYILRRGVATLPTVRKEYVVFTPYRLETERT
ncbi:uncharacterized protein PHALS_08131 [Plasmopara halstedii]|uniref:Uncharacterized protein n=1 Tax=Plasmopara halstedii TaxID=4781 RepID=A0A0N7L8P1_PLAHL|nr:uncharacterized protein PHALS_08131 [Plasmopara halstedii]CEG50419.1 hypothetical protein PHALS_08131 [Plasmopara halstedii]|eukprot:XP_024586788.1 hypothetical protein PHALS_08131 [Plasmopara halstedii]